ncbi:hypothetical protein FJD34_00545 [Pseudomonas brenneri]|uniref:Uncharacterized protein n=1 Tax=Pseudomonas brenneri TaxID=129817 RepID=A0A5B2V4T4_9PSED|nr:hypothetical protein [Pseudomonas brenneri]KAA2233848.1 hypothetical protein F1720_02160 [Pseudomonas brenneri]TWR81918.1 hypothetical protein FJD34_00545 [Pseudomonas brenneri]
MPAKIVNDNAGILDERVAGAFFVGTPPGDKLAPTTRNILCLGSVITCAPWPANAHHRAAPNRAARARRW